eukprot:1905264-Pyramimonas_sp.AAC.1
MAFMRASLNATAAPSLLIATSAGPFAMAPATTHWAVNCREEPRNSLKKIGSPRPPDISFACVANPSISPRKKEPARVAS